MGKLNTTGVTLALLAALAAPVPASQKALPDAVFFATCAGRLSALMRHQWMFDGPASDLTAQRLRATEDLLEALVPETEARTARATRIDAHHAFARLLSRSTFSRDPADADWAARTVDARVRECTSVLLS